LSIRRKRKCGIPYRYSSNGNPYRVCIVCNIQLKDNEWVIQKATNRVRTLHLNARKYGNIVHTDHIVDAKGEYMYSKRYLNGI